MAQSRTLKLALLADIANFSTNMNTAGKQSDTLGGQFEAFGKKAALAFAAAGAAVGAFAVSAVKAAVEDSAAQAKLEQTIKATTSATEAQIAGVEKYISTTAVQIGVTDDELRPAFGRLVRSVEDTDKATQLLNLAMDLSSATTKPLSVTTEALARAYDGNYTSLNKLGLSIDATAIKTKDFDGITNTLAATYGSFAENEAETMAKKFERIKIATEEAKESIGAALLPIVEKLTDYIITNVVPAIESFVSGLTGEGSIETAMTDTQKTAFEWGERIKSIMATVIEFKDVIIATAAVMGTLFVVSKISAAVTATIALIKTLITAYNALKASAIVTGVATAFALNPLLGVGAVALAAGVLSGANALANRSNPDLPEAPSTGAIPYASGFKAPTVPPISGGGTGGTGGTGGGVSTAAASAAAATATSNIVGTNFNAGTFRQAEAASMGTTINLTVVGAYDKEGTARTIVETLNNSSYRGGGGGAGSLVML